MSTSYIKKVYQRLKNTQSCHLCGARADPPLALCSDCELDLPWLGTHESLLLVEGATPGQVLQVIAPWHYRFPIDSLVIGFKHQAQWSSGACLGQLLVRHIQQAQALGLAKVDLLLPVPLAARRMRQRGFNQAALLARWLSRGLGLPYADRLRRLRDTPAQQHLSARERQHNLRGAFALARGFEPRGLRLGLVDDVFTTGATASQLAGLLYQAGAIGVDLYCLARTPAPA